MLSDIQTQPFTELLGLFRLEASVYNNAKFCGDWLVEENVIGQTCFHMPTEGGCWLDVPGHMQCELNCGDLVIFPYELAHVMRPLTPQQQAQQFVQYPQGQFSEGTGMICGRLDFQHFGSKRVLDVLPPVFIIRKDESTPWLESLLQLIVVESHQQNSMVVLNRLCELLFIQALRHFLQHSDQRYGFLSIYAQPKVGAALMAMHKQPERRWALGELAAISGLSRTAFVNLFKQSSGWTVMQYLGWWRMQLAWSALSDGDSVAAVAGAVGYQSEASFARAFKKEFGKSVGQVRRGK